METVLLLFALEKVFVCLDHLIEQSNYGTSKLIKKFIYLGRFPTDHETFFGDDTVLIVPSIQSPDIFTERILIEIIKVL